MKLIVIFFAVYSLYSCTVVFYTDKSQLNLPSLYANDYGNIEYVDSVTDEKAQLTKFWAQEAVFAPEARELLYGMEQRGFRFNISAVGVIDYGFFREGMKKAIVDATVLSALSSCEACSETPSTDSAHGTYVSNLITGEAPVGVSSRGEITLLADTNDPVSESRLLKTSNLPPVLNTSLSFTDDAIKNINKLLDKTIFVYAAGNSFNTQPSPIIHREHKFVEELGDRMVVVGSLDPSGFVSHFSQEYQHVTVLAPSDHFIMSRGAKGRLSIFSGTSGAAPLVSGAVADLHSIIPDLTRDEVATIIAKTATPTSIKTLSKQDGHGTLNQYKMLRVGQRLAEKGWPNDRTSLIADAKMYDFADEAKKLAADAAALLQTADEADYKAGFKKLRTAFALDTNNSKTRTMLAKIYRDTGYTVQAMFYDIPAQSAQQASTIKKITRRTSIILTNAIDAYDLIYSGNYRDVVKPLEIENMYTSADHIVEDAIANMEKSVNRLGTERTYPDLYAAKNLTPQQRLLACIDVLSSYGGNERAEQLLNLLIEYARDAHPKLMTEPAVQKAIAKYNFTASSRIKYRIYNFASYIIEYYEMFVNGIPMNKNHALELGETLQEADRQPKLVYDDHVLAKYARKGGMSVADLWQTLRKMAKFAP